MLCLLCLDVDHRYGADLKKQGLDASAQFDKLDADGSGDLSAAELEQFKQLRAVGTVDV
jgi:hypothetical protein